MSTAKRKQEAQKADEMIKQFSDQNAAASDAEQGVEDGAGGAQEALQDQGASQTGEDQGQDGAPADPAPSGQEAPQELPREETADYWRHKFKSLDGILRRKDTELDQMRDMLAAMQQSVQNIEQSQNARQPEPETPLVTKDDEQTFGSDLVDMVRRAAQDTVRSLKGELMETLSNEYRGLKDQVHEVSNSVQLTAKERFEQKLDDHDPSWRKLDSDPQFIEWLQASPTRAREWASAVKALDHEAVAEKFDTYKLLTQQKRDREEAPKNDKRRQLEKQVAPGKSRSVPSEQPDPDDRKTWTSSDIARAFSERKKYSPQEWAKMEREIFAAQQEGRVDYSR